MLFPLTSPFCSLLTGENPAWVQEHSYVTLGIGRIQRVKAGPYFCHLLFSAQLGSQPARHPTRERGGGGGWQESCGAACVLERARAEGVGRAARAPRRPQALFPHLALPLRSLFPACGSQIHVCKSSRARACVYVCACVAGRPCASGRTGPVCAGGGGQLDSGCASFLLLSSLALSFGFLGSLVPPAIPLLSPPPFLPWKRPAPPDEGSGSPPAPEPLTFSEGSRRTGIGTQQNANPIKDNVSLGRGRLPVPRQA